MDGSNRMLWRNLLAIVLCMLVFVLWTTFSPLPHRAPAPRPAAPEAQPAKEAAPAPGAPAAKAPAEPIAPVVAPRERNQIPFRVRDDLAFEGDSLSGRLSKALLPHFHESVGSPDPYTFLVSPEGAPGIFSLEVEDPTNPAKPSLLPLDANWEIAPVAAGDASSGLVFRCDLAGVAITKTIVPAGPEDFPAAGPEGQVCRHLKLTVEVQNKGTEARDFTYRIIGPTGFDTEDLQTAGNDLELVSGTWGSGGSVQVESIAAAKVGHRDLANGGLAWLGGCNNYFTSIFFPLPVDPGHQASFIEKGFADAYPDTASLDLHAQEKFGRPFAQLDPASAATVRDKAYKNLRVAFRSFKLRLEPGAAPVRHEYGLFIGPRDPVVLERFSTLNFQGVNHYGMWSLLVKFFIWLLGVLKVAAFGSWGVAIMLLTFLVKVCLHPINKRTQSQMQRFQKQMQKIKPQMDELKERYGNNRARMQQEVHKLWKEHNINPGQQMAGCLIMFLQLPIWYGLYSTLRYAPGLRQAGFLYIKDLTKPDHLIGFGTTLPILGEWFNLLPILYVILTLVNQRLQPKPEDPQMRQQYNMMTFMMVFFGFIFYQFPAGFMLYIMTSAALGILESKIIKAELRREEAKGGSGGSGGSSASAVPSGTVPPGGAMYPARSRKAEADRREKRPGKGF
jgi:YidC/Oxa1 family membrane protein insertase